MPPYEPMPVPEPGSPTELRAGLYLHVPFCTSVCPYCDFAVTIAGEDRRNGWATGIVREAEMYASFDLGLDTVYLGGGTPSILPGEQLATVIDGVRRHLDVGEDAVFFLEANPDDVSGAAVRTWLDLGIRFISLGVQSFDEEDLAFLGRRHSVSDARKAVETLCAGGFDTVSVDLIYGLEGRSRDHWRCQLEAAVAFGVQHLSCYQLTVHEGTVLGRRLADGTVSEVAEGEQAELFFLTHEHLSDLGFEGYEVSNFATAVEHRSSHNRKYWEHAPYLGLGPSAHSFVGGCRWWNQRKLRLWQSAVDEGVRPIEDEERPSLEELALEALMLGFRTADGVDVERLRERFGIDLMRDNAATVDRLCASGHLQADGSRLQPTLRGLAVADTLARSFNL